MEHQNRQRQVTFLICTLLLFSVVLGCRQLGKRNSRSLDNRNGNSNGGQVKSTDGLTEKTGLYITQCVNKYSSRVMDSYRRYASWIRDVESGPTGKENLVYGLYDIGGDGHDCVDAIKKARSIEPAVA